MKSGFGSESGWKICSASQRVRVQRPRWLAESSVPREEITPFIANERRAAVFRVGARVTRRGGGPRRDTWSTADTGARTRIDPHQPVNDQRRWEQREGGSSGLQGEGAPVRARSGSVPVYGAGSRRLSKSESAVPPDPHPVKVEAEQFNRWTKTARFCQEFHVLMSRTSDLEWTGLAGSAPHLHTSHIRPNKSRRTSSSSSSSEAWRSKPGY